MSTLVEVSTAEKTFIVGGIEADIRVDGRTRLERRPIDVQVGVVSNANGSARVKLMGTDILAGVKLEVGTPPDEHDDEGLVEFVVSASQSSVSGLGGRSGEATTRALTSLVSDLHKTAAPINLKKLCIIEGQAAWHVKVDILVLQCLGGNIVDATQVAVKAALQDTKIPSTTIIRDSDGDPVDFDISSDPFDVVALEGADTIPLAILFGVISSRFFVDPTLEEEACSDSCVTIGVGASKEVVYVRQHSQTRGVDPSTILTMQQSAGHLLDDLEKAIQVAVEGASSSDNNDDSTQ